MTATTEQVNRPVAMLMAGKEGLERVKAMGVVRYQKDGQESNAPDGYEGSPRR